MDSKLTAYWICDCSIRVAQSFVLFLGFNCFSGIQTYTLHQLYIDLIHLIWNIPQFFLLKIIPELSQHNGCSSIVFVKVSKYLSPLMNRNVENVTRHSVEFSNELLS